MIWTADFWKGAGERAIKTFFQSLVALIGVSAVGFQDVNWILVFSGAGLSAVLSLATSIGNGSFTAGTSSDAIAADDATTAEVESTDETGDAATDAAEGTALTS